MSSIYVNEPATTGKVCMKTSVGDIDIELWAKETPKACRNFIQLAMEGYFDNLIFHRVVKDFIVQGGDSTGTGLGGESIYDNEPFKDEFHSRLKFNRRGLLGLANAGKDQNTSAFFFTMAKTPELTNKHTLFGKVTGTTIFNMLKLQEGVVDANERPEEPKRIISIEILKNPFDDIVPRELKSKRQVEEVEAKSKSRATKDFKLLSFGEEAEEEESDLNMVIEEKFKNKGKSLPDLIEDKSRETEFKKAKRKMIVDESDDLATSEKPDSAPTGRPDKKLAGASKFYAGEQSSNESEDEYAEEKKKMEKARMEIENLKREEFRRRAIEKIDKQEQSKQTDNPVLNEFRKANEKYSKCNYSKSANREQQSLALLEKFKKKLKNDAPAGEESSWLKHKLQVEEEEEENPVLAKDANLKNDADWYDVHDPRNPINKQRREMDAGVRKKKKRT